MRGQELKVLKEEILGQMTMDPPVLCDQDLGLAWEAEFASRSLVAERPEDVEAVL